MTTIALAIPTTADWVPERAKSLARLGKELGEPDRLARDGRPDFYAEFRDRAPNHVWSRKLWDWGAKTGATHLLQLQDDVRVPAVFWPALEALLEEYPDDVIGLETTHPGALEYAGEGVHVTSTTDCLVGVGYVLPRAVLLEFLAWIDSALKPGGVQGANEDTLIGLFCLVTGRRILHPCPTIIDHDVEIASTYGNDEHASRRPVMTWEHGSAQGALMDREFWRAPPGGVPNLGRKYGDGIPLLAEMWVKGWTRTDRARVMANDGALALRRVAIRRELRELGEPRTSVYIATRTRGRGHPEYFSAMWRTLRASHVDAIHEWDVYGIQGRSQDLVRTTSRIFREFLDTSCDALYLVDDDVAPTPQALLGMLRTGRDFVCCPYPMRDDSGVYKLYVEPEIDRILSDPAKLLEALEGGDGTLPVNGMGLGCTLLRRSALEKMISYYENEPEPEELEAWSEAVASDGHVPFSEPRGGGLVGADEVLAVARKAYDLGRSHGHRLAFVDVVDGKPYRTIALPLLIVTGDRRLLPEDLSFFMRAKRAGVEPRMYFGPGSPVSHYGDHRYEGKIEHFGLSRTEGP